MGCLAGPVRFLDLPAHRQTRLGQHPARELCRLVETAMVRLETSSSISRSLLSMKKAPLDKRPEVPLSFLVFLCGNLPIALQGGTVNNFFVGCHLFPHRELGKGKNFVLVGKSSIP